MTRHVALPRSALVALLCAALVAFAPDLLAAGLDVATNATDNVKDWFEAISDNIIWIALFLMCCVILFSFATRQSPWVGVVVVAVGCLGLGSIDQIHTAFTSLGS